jgi:hypothetical protein
MQGDHPTLSRSVFLRPATVVFTLLALVPVTFIALSVVATARNIVYWDEFDTVLDLLLALDAGVDWRGFLERIFAINNEHRMITSRLLFAGSWWLTGTVDFRVIGAIGNLFLVALCVLLVASAGDSSRRIRLGVILAFLMFQFGHYENLLWSGSSIDHFQVVALAVGMIVLLARGTTPGLIGGGALAILATFTLAQGLMSWPVGAFMLWRMQRRPAFWGWSVVALLTVATFLYGFEVNSGHKIATADHSGIRHVVVYWLALLGAPAALGSQAVAPFAGVALLAGLIALGLRGAWRREAVMLPVVLFCLGALALIAIGRSEVGGGQLQSRYLVLSALAWSALLFVGIEHLTPPARPWRVLVACVPLFAAYNVAANIRYLPAVESFMEGRDFAALRYKQLGRMSDDQFRLYPVPERANLLLKQAAQRGVYWLPRMCVRTPMPDAKPSARIAYFIDEMTAHTPATSISGWAAIPGRKSRRGEIHLVLRSPTTDIVYSTVTLSRPDVAAAHANPDWRLCGFRFAVGRWRLPAEELQVGILIKDGDEAEFIMTEHRLRPFGRGEALLANSQ